MMQCWQHTGTTGDVASHSDVGGELTSTFLSNILGGSMELMKDKEIS